MTGDKSQAVRVVDVVLLGPFMIWAGARQSTLPVWMRVGLGVTGAATMIYNGANFVENLELTEAELAELEDRAAQGAVL